MELKSSIEIDTSTENVFKCLTDNELKRRWEPDMLPAEYPDNYDHKSPVGHPIYKK